MMSHKTFKRETAGVILIFMGFVVWQAVSENAIETLKIVIWPSMLFVGAAFGMDWASKETNLVGPKR